MFLADLGNCSEQNYVSKQLQDEDRCDRRVVPDGVWPHLGLKKSFVSWMSKLNVPNI